jgi:squalene cyclase
MQNNTFDLKSARAYANGALDGYTDGKNRNPYDNAEDALLYYVYESGYWYGVSLYGHNYESEITE